MRGLVVKGEGYEKGMGRRKGRRHENRRMQKASSCLCGFLREYGWAILNGDTEGDEEGEWTYTGGRGESVIDYVVEDERTRKGIEKLRVKEKVDSDHQPIVVYIKGRE